MVVLQVIPERGVLHERPATVRAQVRPFPGVLPEVDPEGLGQSEPAAALLACVGSFASVGARVFAKRPASGVSPGAHGATERRRVSPGVRLQVIGDGKSGATGGADVRPLAGRRVHAALVLAQVARAGEGRAALGARMRLGAQVHAGLVKACVVAGWKSLGAVAAGEGLAAVAAVLCR